jgi:hypothetical protein
MAANDDTARFKGWDCVTNANFAIMPTMLADSQLMAANGSRCDKFHR